MLESISFGEDGKSFAILISLRSLLNSKILEKNSISTQTKAKENEFERRTIWKQIKIEFKNVVRKTISGIYKQCGSFFSHFFHLAEKHSKFAKSLTQIDLNVNQGILM
jgi:hypothetical protein